MLNPKESAQLDAMLDPPDEVDEEMICPACEKSYPSDELHDCDGCGQEAWCENCMYKQDGNWYHPDCMPEKE